MTSICSSTGVEASQSVVERSTYAIDRKGNSSGESETKPIEITNSRESNLNEQYCDQSFCMICDDQKKTGGPFKEVIDIQYPNTFLYPPIPLPLEPNGSRTQPFPTQNEEIFDYTFMRSQRDTENFSRLDSPLFQVLSERLKDLKNISNVLAARNSGFDEVYRHLEKISALISCSARLEPRFDVFNDGYFHPILEKYPDPCHTFYPSPPAARGDYFEEITFPGIVYDQEEYLNHSTDRTEAAGW